MGLASLSSLFPLSKGYPMTHPHWRLSGALRSYRCAAAAWRLPRLTVSVSELGTSAWPQRVWMERWAWELPGDVAVVVTQPQAPGPSLILSLPVHTATAVRLQCRHPQAGDHEAIQPRGTDGAL